MSVQDASGRLSRVDLPMRAFAGGYYAQLKAMYDHLGVPYHAKRFVFAFSRTSTSTSSAGPGPCAAPYFLHASNNHIFPPARPRESTLLRHISEMLYLAVCYLWLTVCFFAVAPRDAEDFEQYLRRIRIPWYFVAHYILPMMCGVSTCTAAVLLKFPAQDLVTYKTKTHGADHFVVSGGVHTAQTRLTEGLHRTVFGAHVVQVQPGETGVAVTWTSLAGSDKQTEPATEHFDRVVLAVAPDVVAKVFAPLRALLSRIPTVGVESALLQSKDVKLQLRVVQFSKEKQDYEPESLTGRGDAAEVMTLHSSFSNQHDAERTEAIHQLGNGARVATCAFSALDEREVLHQSRWTRVVRSVESRKILNGIFEEGKKEKEPRQRAGPNQQRPLLEPTGSWRNGNGNVWLAGGWCWDGMVLLEGCVVSAARIARDFDVVVPWLQHV